MPSTIQNFRDYTAKILSSEKNSIKVEKEAKLSISLVFPNSYNVGMANLGFQALYRLFNNCPDVRCERAFYYESFPNIARTLESAQQLIHFDMIAFSVSFEMDYLNIVKIIKNTGLNVSAKDRNTRDPLIIAGGTATFINPQPIARFIDLFIIGEVEPAFNSLIEQLMLMKSSGSKDSALKQLSGTAGFYAPQFYDSSNKVIKTTANIKEISPQFSAVTTSFSHFQDMFLIEVGRGCGRYCRFCAASHVYHPVRFFKPEKILNTIEQNIDNTSKIGLVGAALCDYPKLTELCNILVDKKYQLGLSSFRFETISPAFLDVIQKGTIKTITLAPEAGTLRLRKVINKPISDELIKASIEQIAKSEILNLKLYFLIGLPFEKQQDIDGMINLITQVRNIFFSHSKKRRALTVSVNSFIPKPFTPFQWCGMESEKNLKNKRRFIANELKKVAGVNLTKKSTKAEILQSVISLGDQQLADYLISITSSNYSNSPILKHLKEKTYLDPLPWDFIAHHVKKQKLWQEWQKAKQLALF